MILLLASLGLAAPDASLAPGAYAIVLDSATSSKVAFAGTTEVVTRSLVRARLAGGAEGGWTLTQEVCDVVMSSDSRAETLVPDAFVAALPEQTFPVLLERRGDEVRFQADPGPTHLGYDPALAPEGVPDDADHPAIVDADGDGHPGVTVHLVLPVVGTARIYVAQRGHTRYDGSVQDGVVRGSVEQVTLDQQTLGASFAPLAANPTVTPVPERSRFTMAPIPASTDCAALVRAWDQGFTIPGPQAP